MDNCKNCTLSWECFETNLDNLEKYTVEKTRKCTMNAVQMGGRCLEKEICCVNNASTSNNSRDCLDNA